MVIIKIIMNRQKAESVLKTPLNISLILLTILFVFSTVVDATPLISSWSSSGGTATNKDNAQDNMYLVQQGNLITFDISASGANSYKWFVNKVDQNINSNSFTWNVPNQKSIWEIRAEASDGTGTSQKEWIISTFSSSEAPAIFEYFTDGKYFGRLDKDPWERPLRGWSDGGGTSAPVVSNGFLEIPSAYLETIGIITTNTSNERVAYGTWKFYAKIPGPNGDGTVKMGFLSKDPSDNAGAYQHTVAITKDTTQHFYFYSRMPAKLLGDSWQYQASDGLRPTASHYATLEEDLTNTNFPADDNWHEYTIVREKIDGVPLMRMYVDNELVKNILVESFCYNNIGKSYECDESFADYLWFRVTNNVNTYSMLDGIQVYNRQYLYPDAGVVYKGVGEFQMFEDGAYGTVRTDTNTIQIGWNKTLSEIALIINNNAVFEYDYGTKTAISHTNLTIIPGGKLSIKDEKLIFDTSSGSKRFRVMNGATLEIYNSTINTDSNTPFQWFFTSDWPYAYEKYFIVKGLPNRGVAQFNGILIIKDSLIDNGANLILDHPKKLNLENVLFNNMKEIHMGGGLGNIEYYIPGAQLEAAFELYLGDPIMNLSLKNLTFNGATGNERARFVGGDPWALQQLKDSKLNKVILQQVNMIDIHGYYNDNKAIWAARANDITSNTLELINSNLSNASIDIALTPSEVKLISKYYLDVKVTDSAANSISGATVSVINDVDPSIRSDNLNVQRELTMTHAEGFDGTNYQYWKLGGIWDNITKQDDMDSTVTGADGHTPLPSNKAQTLLITDYILNRIGGSTQKTDYTYTIKATYGTKTATITDINPDETWLRQDPNYPAKTIKCNIDAGTCALVGPETGSISGVIRDTKNTPLPGATVTAGGVSSQTDNTGLFLIANLAIGVQQVTAAKQGYVTQTKQVNVVKDSTVSLDFTLSVAIAPAITSYSPISLTPSQDEGTTNTFSVTVNQTVTSKWFLDSIQQSSTSKTYTKTWSYSDAGTHNITYSGENANGTASKTWIVTVNNVADTTPPVISTVGSSSITSSTATITWTTSEPATSQVEYGLTTNYGSATVLNSTLTTSHSVSLTGLVNNTTYHYRVKSRDADNNPANSSEYSFTTFQTSPATAGMWHLDENSGGIAADSSGNNNNGTIYSAAWTAGKLNSALQFNGNAYVSIPDSPSLNPSSEITIEAWFKPSNIQQAGWNKIIAKPYTSYASPYQQYALAFVNNQVVFELNTGGTKDAVTSSASLTADTWYHVAATYNGSEMRLYINGMLNGTLSKSGTIASYPTNVHIGAGIYSDRSTEYINGTIDEVKIMGRALGPEEVKADYEISAPAPTPVATLSINNANANVNETTSTLINLNGMNNFRTATIDLYYNASVVNVTSGSLGFSGYGGSLTSNINNSIGKARFVITTTAIPGPNSPLTLLNVSLKAVGSGGQSSSLGMVVPSLADTNGNPVNPVITNGTFEVRQILAGDVTGNGAVDAIDSLYLSQFVAGTRASLPKPQAGDVAIPCGSIDAIDAMFLKQYVAGTRGGLNLCS